MIGRLLLLFSLAGIVGCAEDNLAAERSGVGNCADNSVTLAFDVTPAAVLRNADVDVTVRWESWDFINQPLATLRVGSAPVVEVEVPLLAVSGYVYEGSLRNPFGNGAPAGTVEVLAEGAPSSSSCVVFPTAATAFVLE